MPSLDLAGQHRFLVRVSGIGEYWRTSEPPSISVETRLEWDGGDPDPLVIADRPAYGDLTVTRGYDPIRDRTLTSRQWRERVGRWHTDISIQDLDAYEVPRGKPLLFRGLLREIQFAGTDRMGTDTAMIGLVFAIYRMGG